MKKRKQNIILSIAVILLLFIGGGYIYSVNHDTGGLKTIEDMGSSDDGVKNRKNVPVKEKKSDDMNQARVETFSDINEINPDAPALVKTGYIDLAVDNLDDFNKETEDIVRLTGGFTDRVEKGVSKGYDCLLIILKVPSENFDTSMDIIKNKGKVLNLNYRAENDKPSYQNSGDEIKALEDKKKDFEEQYEKVKDDVLSNTNIRNRLTETESKINYLKDRMKKEEEDRKYATIYIRIYNLSDMPEDIPDTFSGKMMFHLNNSLSFWGGIVSWFVSAFIYTFPIFILIGIILYTLNKKERKAHEDNKKDIQ